MDYYLKQRDRFSELPPLRLILRCRRLVDNRNASAVNTGPEPLCLATWGFLEPALVFVRGL